jgi:hypothetical protein
LEPETTQQPGQTPDKEVEIKNITVYVSGYTETDPTGVLSPPTLWRQQSVFVSSRQSGQIPAAVCIGFECCLNGQNVSPPFFRLILLFTSTATLKSIRLDCCLPRLSGSNKVSLFRADSRASVHTIRVLLKWTKPISLNLLEM